MVPFNTRYWILAVCCLVVVNDNVLCYNITDVVGLKKYLLGKYDPSIRPIVDQSKPLQVSLHFSLTNLIQIDMMNGQLEGVGYILGKWRDDSLSWTGTEFDDIPRLTFSASDVWTPDIAQVDAIGEEVERVSMGVEKNGRVIWAVARRYTTFCILNMRWYPRDEHVCNFEFVSTRYPFSELKLEPNITGADLSDMRMHGEWVVKDSSVLTMTKQVFGQEVQGVVYSITFGRQPDFILVHKTVPLLLLAVSYLFVHIVPLNSGERVSYAVTVLLAFVFWQAIVTEDLPNNSAKISILSVIMSVCMGCSTATTVISVVLCRIADCNEDHPKPKLLVMLAKRLRWNNNSYSLHSRHGSKISKRETKDDHHEEQGGANDDESHNGTEVNAVDVSWLEAANAIDLIAMLLLSILTLVMLILFIFVYLARIMGPDS